MRKLIDLGWCMARLTVDAETAGTLRIMSPANYTEPMSPAESITVWGDTSLIALRDALIEAYPLKESSSE